MNEFEELDAAECLRGRGFGPELRVSRVQHVEEDDGRAGTVSTIGCGARRVGNSWRRRSVGGLYRKPGDLLTLPAINDREIVRRQIRDGPLAVGDDYIDFDEVCIDADFRRLLGKERGEEKNAAGGGAHSGIMARKLFVVSVVVFVAKHVRDPGGVQGVHQLLHLIVAHIHAMQRIYSEYETKHEIAKAMRQRYTSGDRYEQALRAIRRGLGARLPQLS